MIAFCYTQFQLLFILLFCFNKKIDLSKIALVISERFSEEFVKRLYKTNTFDGVYVYKHLYPPQKGYAKKVEYLLTFKKKRMAYLDVLFDKPMKEKFLNDNIITGSPDAFILKYANSKKSIKGRLLLVEDGNMNYVNKPIRIKENIYHMLTSINPRKNIKNAKIYYLQEPKKANLIIKRNCPIEQMNLDEAFRMLTSDQLEMLETIFNIARSDSKEYALFWSTDLASIIQNRSDEINQYYLNIINGIDPEYKVIIKSHPADKQEYIKLIKRKYQLIDKEVPLELLYHFGYRFKVAIGPYSSVFNSIKGAEKIIQAPITNMKWKRILQKHGFPKEAFYEQIRVP